MVDRLCPQRNLRAPLQSSGPYHLLGWSLGGHIAQEIAAQLQFAGEDVATLVILDAYPTTRSEQDGTGDFVSEIDAEELDILVGEGFSEALSEVDLEIAKRVVNNGRMALLDHQTQSLEGDILMFSAGEDASDGKNPVGEWQPYVSGSVEHVSLPCRHGDMTRPDILSLVWKSLTDRKSLQAKAKGFQGGIPWFPASPWLGVYGLPSYTLNCHSSGWNSVPVWPGGAKLCAS